MKTSRPVLKIIPPKADSMLDLISLSGLLLIWVFTVIQFSKLPTRIPIHFNFKGEIDNYGNSVIIFLVPVIVSMVFTGLTILNRYPHLFKYPSEITADNALNEYTKATRLIRIIKLFIVGLFGLITLDIVQSAKVGSTQCPWWLIPVFILTMLLTLLITFYKSTKKQ